MRNDKWDPPVVQGIDQHDEEALSTQEVEGEPTTVDDEFAADDAPEQSYDNDV